MLVDGTILFSFIFILILYTLLAAYTHELIFFLLVYPYSDVSRAGLSDVTEELNRPQTDRLG